MVNAVVWDRLYNHTDYTEVWADALPPKALLAIAPSSRPESPRGFVLHATDPRAAEVVLEKAPSGPVFFSLTDASLLPLIERRAVSLDAPRFWLFRLDAKDFVDQQAHEVRPVTPEWAPMIAKIWEPEWPAERYVRGRIESGPSFGVYVDGELVAWDMTHFETDKVVMMGFLHVLEAHRAKGYAKSMGSALIREILGRGKIPACHVREDNAVSLELTEGLGFRRVRQQIWADGVLR